MSKLPDAASGYNPPVFPFAEQIDPISLLVARDNFAPRYRTASPTNWRGCNELITSAERSLPPPDVPPIYGGSPGHAALFFSNGWGNVGGHCARASSTRFASIEPIKLRNIEGRGKSWHFVGYVLSTSTPGRQTKRRKNPLAVTRLGFSAYLLGMNERWNKTGRGEKPRRGFYS